MNGSLSTNASTQPVIQTPRQIRVTPSKLIDLQSNVRHIRNICILAHVDHGKTTLSDSLLASNGIISSKLAGKIRYLDSREDEQIRGITMESSAISLYFNIIRRKTQEDQSQISDEYLINLIDSPGHVDFSCEVSTASRLCDGGLVLVDVVEGVCTQTIMVLRQAWIEGVRPLLVFNKMDRLITELKLSPVDAHVYLNKLLEQVNANMGSFFASDRVQENLHWREKREAAMDDPQGDLDLEYEEKDDQDIYFAPERGNVIFASAIDGWAFRIDSFAQLYSRLLGIKESILKKYLWGDYYLDAKTKRVMKQKHLKGRNLKPMFVQFVLDNIWAIYDSVILNPNQEKVQKIVGVLNLKILPRDLKSKDSRILLTSIFSQWLPLSTSILLAVIEHLPSPDDAQKTRMPKLLYPEDHDASSIPKNSFEAAIYECKSDDNAPKVAFVSKMLLIDAENMPENQRKPMTAEEMRAAGQQARAARQDASASHKDINTEERIPSNVDPETDTDQNAYDVAPIIKNHQMIGFGRLYSGILRVGQKIKIFGPKFDPRKSKTQHVSETIIEGLYMLMGRDMIKLDAVPAGNVFGIRGLEGKVLKSGTIFGVDIPSDTWKNLGGISMATNPIVRVALEPEDPSDMDKLVEGLKLLNQADSCVEVLIEESGEHVIFTAGELHLERCLKDLRERFAKTKITASAPIVPFRETTISIPELPTFKDSSVPRGKVTLTTSGKNISLTLRVVPLPQDITSFLSANIETIRKIVDERRRKGGPSGGGFLKSEVTSGATTPREDVSGIDLISTIESAASSSNLMNEETFWSELEALFLKLGGDWTIDLVDRIWAFGPKNVGSNILFDHTNRKSLRKQVRDVTETSSSLPLSYISPRDFDDALHTAFQISTYKGPLCAEPVIGTAVFVENIEILDMEDGRSKLGQISGAVLSAARDAYRTGFLEWSPRLMLAMYKCEIQATAEVLGKVYATVARHKGTILGEEMKEGTPFFSISATLPVIESFGFGDDIRRRTSGAASPQLIFSGFRMLDQDPFWVPTTEEELEDLGEKADRENIAKRYMDKVRKRKGLFVERKIVEHAEKQRTLKK